LTDSDIRIILYSMTNTTTTTRTRKIEKPSRKKLAFPQKAKKPYSRRDLAAEVERLTGEKRDPGYLADVANGNRFNKTRDEAIRTAIDNLTQRAKAS
jgi:hypothetical protein